VIKFIFAQHPILEALTLDNEIIQEIVSGRKWQNLKWSLRGGFWDAFSISKQKLFKENKSSFRGVRNLELLCQNFDFRVEFFIA